MLHTDQNGWSAPQNAHGYAGTAGPLGGRLHEIAREIEETQRRQGETMQHIVERLRIIDQERRETSAAAQHATLDQAGDEPWDGASAEALMQSYETGQSENTAAPPFAAGAQTEWLSDVTHRIKRTLSDLKRGNTIVLLEERLDQFQRHIASALDDVVRRSDVEGLRLIETHVNELGDKLDVLERHVQRLDAVETDVRSIMDQVSDERIGKLLDYDSRFSADLETLAKRVAEEMHARFGRSDEAERRHDELRALIEASIQDRRQAETEATSLVSGLSGRITAQSDRNDEIKSLLDRAIEEQRHHEKTAVGMLDTLQQALVEVLDRLDALESQQRMMAWPVAADAPAGLHHFVPADDEDPRPADASADAAPGGFPDVRLDDAAPARDMELPAAVEIPAAFEEPAPVEDGNESPVERLRRDFIADARRAKMKAAANRAEAAAETKDAPKRSGIEAARAALTEAARLPLSQGSGRLFGASPKLLAGALALVVAINGGLLLLNRKSASHAPAPEITIQQERAPGADAQDPTAEVGRGENPDAPAIAPSQSRSDLQDSGTGLTDFATPSREAQTPPYGYSDDVLNPPAADSNDGAAPASAPRGMTISKSAGSVPNDVVADVYQQQVLASLSGKLGTIAATQSPDALIPERSGRIDTAYTTASGEAEAVQGSKAGDSALDLPPATVGPLSLRLAAASGDASAEFEVAARLAEGKGTDQSFAEALRWYQRSATKGFAQAQYRLGTLYERGLGVSKDAGRARVWYSRAAEQGNVKSMHNLAVLAAGGDSEPDYPTAIQWFGKAAEHGLADSQYNLGVLLENGLGVKADRVTAYKWYSLAAKTGDADAKARQDALKAALSADDLKSAEGMIAAFRPLAAIPLANDARAAGEDWKKRVNNETNG